MKKLIVKQLKSLMHRRTEQKYLRIHTAHERLYRDEYIFINDILRQYREEGGLSHQFQGYKLWSLERLLQRRKPRTILELGTGSSTAIFAKYVDDDFANRRLTSVDECNDWLQLSIRIANPVNSSSFKFIHGQSISERDATPPTVSYDVSLTDKYDLVFIDGPSLRIDGVKVKSAVNSNIFDVLHYHQPDLIVVDIRKSTVNELKGKIGDLYDCQCSDVLVRKAFKWYNYLTVFTHRRLMNS